MSRFTDFPPVDPADVLALKAPEQCAGCSRLEQEAPSVTLLAGQQVCTYCPAWLEECRLRQLEAFQVLDLPDVYTRRHWLESREREFGAEYRRRLEAVILSTWQSRRAAADAEA